MELGVIVPYCKPSVADILGADPSLGKEVYEDSV